MGGKYQISSCPYHRSTLGFVDQANAYRLRYHYLHQTLKHTRAQFISIFFITLVNSCLIYKHLKGDKDYTYRSYLRDLAEALARAGGHHRKQEHPRAQLSKSVIPQAVHLGISIKVKRLCIICNKHNCSRICTGRTTNNSHPIYGHEQGFARRHAALALLCFNKMKRFFETASERKIFNKRMLWCLYASCFASSSAGSGQQ